MALEDRIKLLEGEIAVLKGQIHSTLLEIQEQILNHYYPDLRADESGPAEVASRGSRPSRTPGFVGLQRVTLGEPAPTDSQPDGAEGEPTAPGAPAPQPAIDRWADWPLVTRLMKWASESVERIGRERTAKAIEICAQGGFLAPGVRDMLLQLIALSDDQAAPTAVGLRAIADTLSELNDILDGAADMSDAARLVE